MTQSLTRAPDNSEVPRRRFLDDLTLSEARARILLALSVLGHSSDCDKAAQILRGELAL